MSTASLASSSFSWSSHEPCPENANFYRLITLLIQGGRDALMEAVVSRLPNGLALNEYGINIQLRYMLTNNECTLRNLKNRKVLKQTQWDLLYPQPQFKKWDISLLFILFRNTCNYNPKDPLWERDPPISNISIQADVIRLKRFRNQLQGHCSEAKVEDNDFNLMWDDMADVITRLSSNCNPKSTMMTTVNKIKKMSLDTRREQEVLSEFQDWILSDKIASIEDITKCLHHLDQKIEQIKELVSDKTENMINNIHLLVKKMEKRLKEFRENKENIDSTKFKDMVSKMGDEVVGGVYSIVSKAEGKIIDEMKMILSSGCGKELLKQILDDLKDLARESQKSFEMQRNLTLESMKQFDETSRKSQISWERIEQKVDHVKEMLCSGIKRKREYDYENANDSFGEDSGFEETESIDDMMKSKEESYDEKSRQNVTLSCSCFYMTDELKQFCKFLAKTGHCCLQCYKCEKVWTIAEIRTKTRMNEEENSYLETALSVNYIKKEEKIKICPNCKTYCERIAEKNPRVECRTCSKGSELYEFCWHCLNAWKSDDLLACGNDDCITSTGRYFKKKKTECEQMENDQLENEKILTNKFEEVKLKKLKKRSDLLLKNSVLLTRYI